MFRASVAGLQLSNVCYGYNKNIGICCFCSYTSNGKINVSSIKEIIFVISIGMSSDLMIWIYASEEDGTAESSMNRHYMFRCRPSDCAFLETFL